MPGVVIGVRVRGIAGRTTSGNIRRMVRADEMIVTAMVPDAIETSVGRHSRTLDDAAPGNERTRHLAMRRLALIRGVVAPEDARVSPPTHSTVRHPGEIGRCEVPAWIRHVGRTGSRLSRQWSGSSCLSGADDGTGNASLRPFCLSAVVAVWIPLYVNKDADEVRVPCEQVELFRQPD